ncbi:MAG: response regulator transcription factor [Deltaproteobacteria bacterium]|nr:response regulator transcription factor [Deltaproteobacteria bacterium]
MHHKSRIFIVDDHPIFRKGLGQLINEENDMIVCGEAEEVNEARRAIEQTEPDMVIVDITLKDKSGLELIKYLHDEYEDIPALVISMHDESLYAERALKSGARGYIMKEEMTTNVIHAIRHVLQGKIYASDNVINTLLGKLGSKSELSSNPVESLSDRELEVFQLIGKGFGRKEIADILGVSVKTIGSYREIIKRKLNLKNAPELMKRAIEWRNTSGR